MIYILKNIGKGKIGNGARQIVAEDLLTIEKKSSKEQIENDLGFSVSNIDDSFVPKIGGVHIPEDFVHPFGNIKIERPVNGPTSLININRDYFRSRQSNPVVKYIDSINGDDLNSGDTWETAYKTLQKLSGVAFDKAYLSAGNYATVDKTWWLQSGREIIGVGGKANIGYGIVGPDRNWIDEGGGVFSNVLTADIQVVVDTNYLDADGDYLRLTAKTSLAEVQASPNSFWKDVATNTLYIRMGDDLSPNRPSLMAVISAMFIGNGTRCYAENIRFMMGVTSGNITAVQTKASFYNCEFLYNNVSNGVSINGNVTTYFDHCVSYKNYLDGFNYHEQGGFNPSSIEYYCSAFDCGENNTSSINNASTIHDSAVILRIGGVYHSTEGPVVHDVNNSLSFNVDCIAYNSISVDAGRRSAFAVAAGALDTTKMWLDGCVSKGVDTYGIENRADDSSFIYVRNSKIHNIKPGVQAIIY